MAEYYFNLPPETSLTPEQRAAIQHPAPIALKGAPGTGKSVVSLRRHMAFHDSGRASLLLTFTTTLKTYLARCCGGSVAANYVRTSIAGKPLITEPFNEIIVDEAQDLCPEYYKQLQPAFSVSFGADDSQILYPENSSKYEDILAIFPGNRQFPLERNFRNTSAILKFARAACPGAYIPHATVESAKRDQEEKPIVLISGHAWDGGVNHKQNNAIINIISQFTAETHNVAVLVPWKKQVHEIEAVIKPHFPDCSFYYEDKHKFPRGATAISNIHITTFKSCKGLEFDTVIMPDFEIIKKLDMLTPDKHVTWKDYYVAITRARSNLFLISRKAIPGLQNVATTENLS